MQYDFKTCDQIGQRCPTSESRKQNIHLGALWGIVILKYEKMNMFFVAFARRQQDIG